MAESVAPETRPRGRADPRFRRLAWSLAVAVLLHLPLTPLGALIGLLSLLHLPAHEPPPDSLNSIPVSLLSPEEMEQLGGGSTPPAPPAEPPGEPKESDNGASGEVGEPAPKPPPKPKPKPKPKPRSEALPDGGVREVADAAPSRPETPAAEQRPDGGRPPSERPSPTPDPMALAGKAATVADPNANVKLLLLTDRIRLLPIAPRIGQLVARLPQWRSFFGPAGLDPIRDIKGIYVAGPQFRVSADVVAVLAYDVPQKAMRRAIDGIVQREPKGEWLDAPLPVARARADRAERIFVLPKAKLVLMVPPHLKDDAIAKAPHLAFPVVGGEAALVAFVAKPWRALAGFSAPVEVPRSIASVSLSVAPTADGGAVLHVDAVDESPEAAREDAALLTRAINALTQHNVGAIGALLFGGQTLSLIEPVDLRAVGKSIRGDAQITPRQLERLLGFAEGWVDAITGGPPMSRGSASVGPSSPPKLAPPPTLPSGRSPD